jgi:Asp-tRNA(Asn)/Glu-tRNA(Gln) amidotransferase A subunit family amidase
VLAERPAWRRLAAPAGAPRIGLYRTPAWDAAEPATAAALDAARAAFEKAGAIVAEIAIAPEHEGLNDAQNTIMLCEMAGSLSWERLERAAMLSPRLAQMLDAGLATGAADYDAALARRDRARVGLDAFFGDCDAMLVPAAPGAAPPGLGNTGDPVFNRMWTLLGTPCVTLPASWAANGLPVGVQLVGRVRDDARVLSCALFLERALAAR